MTDPQTYPSFNLLITVFTKLMLQKDHKFFFYRTVHLTRHNAPFSCYSLVLQARGAHYCDKKILEGKANAVFLCTPKHCLLLNLPEEVLDLFLVALFPPFTVLR